MKKIAITGGIGSGKSAAAQYIQNLGFPVFSCDEIYKQLIEESEYIASVANLFPESVINGTIDKKKLSEIVFSDSAKRNALNNLAHPLIMKTLYRRMEACGKPFVFAEVPLLFEGNFEKDFDFVFVIQRNLDKRISSVSSRDHTSEENVKKRIAAQFDYTDTSNEKLQKENVITIFNNSSKEDLFEKIKTALNKLKMI